jgi:hypothetical protein
MKGVRQLNLRAIARGAGFIGTLLLLYALASGFALASSTEATEAALRQHAIVGTVGTALCIAAVIILLRLKS